MKLLVFAHVPPPHHGQSYMVQLMLNGFGGDRRIKKNRLQEPNPLGIECYHVNARYSKTLEDIGEFQSIKLLRLFLFCLEAIWCRFRYGVENFYYVPAPGKKVALYRDWLVMLLCRPFFKRIILHWHAAGLAKWLETSAQIRWRAVSCRLFKPVDLSIVLAKYNIADAEKLLSRRICVIGNGIPNPCPDFEKEVLPRRKARLAARAKLVAGQKLTPADLENTGGDPHRFRVLFLAHCTRQKGLFDTLDGVALASERLLRTGSPIRIYLTVAGEFFDPRERIEFEQRIAQPDLQFPVEPPAPGQPSTQPSVTYTGFVNGAAKHRVFTECDCFCFPTYYHAESFGLVLVEAMAFGLPIVTTRWRSIPEIMPPDYPGLVDTQSPEQVAAALIKLASERSGESLRENFLARFTIERHLENLAQAIRSVETLDRPR